MSDPFFDKLIADLVKGAEANSRASGGPGVRIEIDRENRGREEKLAVDASTILGGIPALGPHLSGWNAAARDQSMGSGGMTGVGSALGQAGGSLAGSAIGGKLDNDKLHILLSLLGMSGGGMLGAAGGRGLDRMIEGEGKQANLAGPLRALEARFTDGALAAAAAFGVKEAFLGAAMNMLGSVGGGMAARKLLPKATGMLGNAVEMGGQLAGGAIANRLAPAGPPQA